MLLGGIEAGGTKMVCAIGDEKGNLFDRVSIKTTDNSEETINNMLNYFKNSKIEALGIGSFGPVDLDRTSATYGYITSTPKKGWKNTDFISPFKSLNVPIGIDTDVNGAILGEVRFGAAIGVSSALYVTIGTGVGVGVYIDNHMIHGAMHPEGGHILLKPHPKDNFEGWCPYHKNCLEGLAAGPSIKYRWGKEAVDLYDSEEVWELEAYYIASALTNYTFMYSPKIIILWGGVMHKDGLLDIVRKKTDELIAGYVDTPLIVTPSLEDNPGIIGAIQIGYDELKYVLSNK